MESTLQTATHASHNQEKAALAALFIMWASQAGPASPSPTLKLATWNLEWLISPAAFKPLKENCTPPNTRVDGAERRLPCDVAYKLERGTRDFAALARYARQLDADVIALQEVDGPDAASLVFPGYQFCFTARPHVQNSGFAIRASIPHRCGRDLRALSLRDTLRRGAELILYPDEPRELHLLSVHLKSGCSTGTLDGPAKACTDLARQTPALEAWIDNQARDGHRFAVMGDFNRDLLGERGTPARAASGQLIHLWPELDDGDPPEAHLVNAAEHATFRNCTPGQAYTAFIDYIVFSRTLGAAMVPGSFTRVMYTPLDARRTRLSDHCPVAVRVTLP